MPALSAELLHAKLLAALPTGTTVLSREPEVRPAVVELPTLGRFRVYLWTLTEDRSRTGRPDGEFKMQLIVKGQGRGQRDSLELDDIPTVLLGYSPAFGVFSSWEASLYTDFAYSANIQVRDDLLSSALDRGWAVAPPRTSQSQDEVRVSFSPFHLAAFLDAALEADASGISGIRREAFFLSRTPRVNAEEVPKDSEELEEYVQSTRKKVTYTAGARDPRFARKVKEQYDHACALCTVQLGIVEAAHIIPASDERGVDEVWNGISLCPNHHRLFDSRLFVIDSELVVRVDLESVEFLKECGLDLGVEVLTDFDGDAILRPSFWDKDPNMQTRMQRALNEVVARSGLSA